MCKNICDFVWFSLYKIEIIFKHIDYISDLLTHVNTDESSIVLKMNKINKIIF